MMQETMEKRANRTVGKSRQKDFFAVLLFFFLLPYTCSSVVRAGQEKTVETIVPVSGRASASTCTPVQLSIIASVSIRAINRFVFFIFFVLL